ncbi:AraC family transcriptional regulator [Janthinobacterium fluminis]|uniref:AraC family transcriptional regulator n=1 Tax=Janthinobacterium fluminis TaxID=2987524 RepID=A0ABT5K384_9BURK|nr:AraC family transcriptional regulator [Janthinobacterium fluminis]MDC8759443.1 AraC family transcriptional regulator [Janthinobacterium fluminis]
MQSDKQIEQWNAVHGADIELVRASMGVCGLDGHFHDRWSIGLIVRGVCRFNSGERQYRVTPADIFIIPPYEVHRCGAASDDVMYQVMYVADAALAALAPHLKCCVEGSHLRTKSLPEPVIALLRAVTAADGDVSAVRASLHRLDAFFRGAETAGQARSAHPLQEVLHRGWDLAIDLGAAECATVYSRWHGIRTFQRQIGLSPRLYLRQLRALKARYLLQQGKSLAEVAHALHFADQAHFSRVFKSVFGVSPGKLQRVMRR